MTKIVAGLLVGTAIMALMSGMAPAKAQTADSSSSSNSSSNSVSGSRSGAAAVSNSGSNRLNQNSTQQQGVTANTNTGVTLNQTTNAPDRLTTNNTSSGSFANTQSGHTSSDVTVRSAPQVYAPPVSGGNPCTLAVSGGVSVIGWGAAAGGTFVDEDCANRQKIAMIHNAGYAQVAFELMCNDRATYIAAKTAGRACAFRQQFEAPGTPPAAMPRNVTPQIAPTPVMAPVPAPQASKVYPRCNPRLGIVDNCAS